MQNNPVNVEELGSGIGTKRAAAVIAFRDAVERRGARTVGKHMEKIIDDCQTPWSKGGVHPNGKKVNAQGLVISTTLTADQIVAEREFAAIDISGYKYVGFWIKCDKTLTE